MTVSAEQRFTRANPCPICGGWDGMIRGKERRCAGFVSLDGKWAFCARVSDGAHHESPDTTPATWAHLLRDEPLNGQVTSINVVSIRRRSEEIERQLKAIEVRSEAARSEAEYEADRKEYDSLWAELEAAYQNVKKAVAPTEADKPTLPTIQWMEKSKLIAPLPPINWLCKQLRLAPGAVSCFSGFGYSGKTAFAQLLLLSIANGRSFMGLMACESGEVGHLDYEQGWRLSVERYHREVRGMGLGLEEGMDKVRYCPFPEHYVDDQKGRDAIARSVEGLKAVLVDSGRASMPGTEENDSKSRIHIDGLTRIGEKTGVTFVMILHDGKAGQNPRQQKERTRGSSALYDAMQTVWGFEKKDDEDFVRAVLRKDRLTGAESRFGFRFEDSEGDREAEDSWLKIHHLDPEQMKEGDSKASRYKMEVLNCIKLHPGLTSIEEIRFHMPQGYRNLNEVRPAVRELEKDPRQILTVNGAYRAV